MYRLKRSFYLFILFSSFIFLGLGIWQVRRLLWKEQLIHETQFAMTQTAQNIDDIVLNFPLDHPVTVDLEGEFVAQKSIKLAPRVLEGEHGYYGLALFKTKGNHYFLVNRGFISHQQCSLMEEESASAGKKACPIHGRGCHLEDDLSSKESLKGIIYPLPKENWFTPDNKPEKNIWHFIRLNELKAFWQEENIQPVVIYLTMTTGQFTPVGGNIQESNNHLGYALTWFSFTLMIWVFSFVQRRKRKKRKFGKKY